MRTVSIYKGYFKTDSHLKTVHNPLFFIFRVDIISEYLFINNISLYEWTS